MCLQPLDAQDVFLKESELSNIATYIFWYKCYITI